MQEWHNNKCLYRVSFSQFSGLLMMSLATGFSWNYRKVERAREMELRGKCSHYTVPRHLIFSCSAVQFRGWLTFWSGVEVIWPCSRFEAFIEDSANWLSYSIKYYFHLKDWMNEIIGQGWIGTTRDLFISCHARVDESRQRQRWRNGMCYR